VKDQIKKNKKNFLINFEKVKFIDSMGIGELIASFKSAHDSGGKLKLMKLSPKIFLLFQITLLVKIFEIFDDEEEAIRSFSE
jgi:anti-anti-sigma factor